MLLRPCPAGRILKSCKSFVSIRSHSKIAFECNAVPAPGNPFHLAIPVHDLDVAKAFYGESVALH